MVIKKIRSEYMKKFKDPKWENYTKCYEEMLKYRLTRRLLEHTHKPWFWGGSDSDSESGGRSPPPPNDHQVPSEATGVRTGVRTETELEECEGSRSDRQEQHPRTSGPIPRLPLEGDDNQEDGSAGQSAGSQLNGARETRTAAEEVRERPRASSRGSKQLSGDRERESGGHQPKHSKPSKSSKQTGSQRVRPAPSRQPGEDSKVDRHPFALYGSGEKDADIAGRKTHNVRPAASTNEIHESAIRAKTRRQVERQIQTQRTERRRAKSADVGKAGKIIQPEFNPWLTEYMRCFSARSR